ncbi:thialysine N-epsilon-acetyltransferase-like isoform X2 [Branchiostoma lanceolatum]|uniref:thialysine N-epsilon-acetyltransferase-like isoform X2 n=1 Tax=Branchiostoma lanceolatum TaxID=7740 RepID=UPI003456569E
MSEQLQNGPSPPGYIIRKARPEDCGHIVTMIKELAEHDGLGHKVAITEDKLREDGFGDNPYFHCFVAETTPDSTTESTQIVGYAMYFFMYCTFVGRVIFLEDFFVYPQFRGSGIGTELMKRVAQVGVETKCTKCEFIVHDENSRARRFYEKLGAVNSTVEGEWRRFFWYKFDMPSMEKLASR